MEYLHASILIAGGLVVLAWVIVANRLTPDQRETLMPVQSFTAVALLCTGAMWLIRGPVRVFDGPPLVVIASVGVSYGAHDHEAFGGFEPLAIAHSTHELHQWLLEHA